MPSREFLATSLLSYHLERMLRFFECFPIARTIHRRMTPSSFPLQVNLTVPLL